MSNKQLSNSWALVTGASSGIGRSLAIELAKRGCHLIITARRKERLDELAHQISEKFSTQVKVIVSDLGHPKGAKMLAAEVEKLALSPSILINNAGKGHFGNFTDFSLNDHLEDIHLNVNSLVSLTHLMIPLIEKSQGQQKHIMNVASVISYLSMPEYAIYTGTKRFVRHFSEILRFELREKNINVSCLCPGGTQTEFMETAGQNMKEGSDVVMMSAEQVARIGIKGMLKKKTAIVPGILNKVTCFLPRLMSSDLMIRLNQKVMSRYAQSAKKT